MGKTRLLVAASVLAIGTGAGSPAWAQATTQSGGDDPTQASAAPALAADGLNDIVVTARRTVENNQKAPASIVAVGGDELLARGVTEPQALERLLPSANLRRQGPVTQIFIRGVGTRTDLPNFASASAFVYNGITIQRYGTFGLTFDLERVESISGPQATLYGASAAGGAVNFYSAVPKNDTSGFALLEGGNYEALHASFAQNVALGEKVSMRAAFDYNRRDAYYERGLSSQNNYSGRLAVKADLTDNLSAHVFWSHGLDTGLPVATIIAQPLRVPGTPYQVPATGAAGQTIDGRNTRQRNRNDVFGANFVWELGSSTLTYIPAYVNFVADYEYYSGLAGNLLQVYDRERQHSQELRWNGNFGRLQTTAGVFYLRNLTDFNDSQLRYTSPTASTRVVLNVTDQVNESMAFYAQGVYSLTDKLRITLGGRVSRDQIDATGIGAANVPISFHADHTHTDYKIGLDYDIADRVLVYANYQTSYIPFGYNPDVAPTPIIPEATLKAWSGGFKSRFLDNRFELNVEGFYYEYRNFQAINFVNATGLSTVLNAEKATIKGIDASLRAQVTPTTRISVSGVIQRARFDVFQGTGYNFSGNKLVNAPDFTLNAGIEQTIPLNERGNLLVRVDTHHEAGRYTNFNNFPFTNQQAYFKTDASLTYTPDSKRWSVQAFVRNIEDAVVFAGLSAGTTATAPAASGLEAPRTYGLQLTLKWD